MLYRVLGNTGLSISCLSIGCASMGSRVGAGRSALAIRAALDAGINCFDTSDLYGMGASEQILGRALRGRRDKAIICTKCGYTYSSRLRMLRWVKPLVRPLVTRLRGVKQRAAKAMAAEKSQCFEPQYIARSIDDSLQRLGADYVDVFYLHDAPATVLMEGHAIEALRLAVKAGKVRFIGVSADVAVLEQVIATPESMKDVAVLQFQLSLAQPRALDQVLPYAVEQGMGVIAGQPFGHGGLLDAATPSGMSRAEAAELALRWVGHAPHVHSVLTGMTRPEHITANVAAMNRGPLAEAEQASCQQWRLRWEQEHVD
jgi:aryl-alcohol dehydrogenase-like predicted oxidoreductase